MMHPQQANVKPISNDPHQANVKPAQSNQSNQLCTSQSVKDNSSAKISYGKNNQSNMPLTIFNLISKPIKFNFVPVMLLLNRIAYEHSLAVETCCFQSSLAEHFPLKKKVKTGSSLPFCSQRIEQIFLPSHQTNKIILLDPQIKKVDSYLCSNYTMKSTRISYSTIPVSNILKNFVDVINAKQNFFNDLSNYTLEAQQNFLCRKYREFANYWQDWKSSHYQSLNRKFPFQAYETQVCDKISGRVKLCTNLFEMLVKNFGDFRFKNLKTQEDRKNTGRCSNGSSVNNLIKENLTKILTAEKLQTSSEKSPEKGNGKIIFEQYLNHEDFKAFEACLNITKKFVNEFLKIFRTELEKALRIDILFSYDPSDRTFCLLSNSKNQLTSNYYFSLDSIQTQLVFQDKDLEANDTTQKNNRSFRACFDRIINQLSRLSDYQKYSAYVYIMNKIFIKCRYKEVIVLEQLMFDLGRKKSVAAPNKLATNLFLALKQTMVQVQEDFNFVIYLDRIMKLGYYDHMKLGGFIDDVLSIYDDLLQRRIFEVSRKSILDPRFGFFENLAVFEGSSS